MQELSIPGNPVFDMGAVDILRARERGRAPLQPVPPPARPEADPRRSTTSPTTRDTVAALARGLRQTPDNVEDIDLLVGTLAEGHRPTGFGFGETMFQIFILNASRRLQADRFYTDDYREEVYTPEGIAWVDGPTFKDVILRHFPELAAHRPGQHRQRLRALGPRAAWHPTAIRSEPGTRSARTPGRGTSIRLRNTLEGARFFAYRRIVSTFLSRGFADHPVEPLAQPVDTMRRYAKNLAPSSVFRLMEVPRPRVLALLVPLPQRVPLGREPAEFPRLEGVVDVRQAGVSETQQSRSRTSLNRVVSIQARPSGV